jgi:gluconokinase
MVQYLVVIMGVAGAGKTTVSKLVASQLGCKFIDADDFHPKENVAKMAKGIPLTDEDRDPWLQELQQFTLACVDEFLILACSSLKKSYRDVLSGDRDSISSKDTHKSHYTTCFVYLDGSFDTIYKRLEQRSSHYMKPQMLKSQFETLEIPDDSDALILSITLPPHEIAEKVVKWLLERYPKTLPSK